MADTDQGAPPNQPSATGSRVPSPDPGAQRNPPSGTFFGLNKNQLHSWGVGVAPHDYKARYPLDPYGQEMSDNARIWPIYNEEAANFDANMVAEWRDTIDVLLVFAGLFSAVLTTFVVQTSQNMQPDYNEASMFLLFEILKATDGSQFSIPPSPTAFFSPTPSDEWLNSLWFVSLTLSLITALVAVLVKQWLHQYIAVVSDSSARDRARIRHMRFAGLQTWQVPMIIGLLPVLLHLSLALFFAGLAVFLFSLGMKVAWLVSIIGAVTYVAYIIALILPLVYPSCPFKVPLTLFVYHLYQFIGDRLILLIALIRRHLYTHLFGHDRDHDNFRLVMNQENHNIISQPRKRPLKEIERDHVQKCATKVDAQSLKWLFSSTSNASVHRSVLQAISGMSSATLKWLPDEYRSAFMVPLDQQIQHIEPLVPSPDVERELELYYRAYILLQPNHFPGLFPDRDHMADQCCNEQLKMALFSMTSSKKALAVFLGILQGPQRSSLTLHSVVWKILVNAAISFPPRPDSGALESELELMKVIESPLTTSESGDVTTIDKPTDEMRRYIVDKFLAGWRFRLQIPARVATGSFDLTFLSLIPRVQQRLSNPADASDRKQLIQTSLSIVERAGFLIHSLPPERSSLVLNILYSLLSSKAFVVVSPDLHTLAHRIFMILDCLRWYQHWIEDICPNMRFYSVAYQCYLYSPTGGDKRSEKDVMPHTLERLVSYSFNLPGLSNDDLLSYNSDLSHYPHFSINGLVQVMLLLIKEHNESILYEWARHPAMRNVWPECLSRLVRWASGEQFRRWTFLKRVLAVVVIGNLQNILGHSGNNKSLPQYYSDAYTGVNQPPWLQEVFSSSDGNLEYSQIAAHPKFQEFLHSKRPTQEIIGDAGSPAVLTDSS